MHWCSVLVAAAAVSCVIALPVTKDKQSEHQELTEEQKKEAMKDEPAVLQDWELSLEYGRYLKEVVQVLESDPEFRKKLEQAEADDIKSGLIARELHFVDHNVRSKLDELKRRELERLRHFAVQEHEKASGVDRSKLKIPVHIDHRNPTRFEVDDLRKLIQQTTHDLEGMDKQRKEDFNKYEMEKEFNYEQQLEKMTPEERKKAEEKHNQDIKKHKNHPKLHHPGSKQQLEEVWEEQDHMSRDDFDPKSFFHLHDLDGNGVWDENEVKALFLKELDKMYDPNASEDDLMERQEEMERMREHIFKEADTNRDDLISFEEFLSQTRRNEFEQDEGWQGLDEQELYSQQEYQQYEQQRLLELQQAGAPHGSNSQPIAGHEAAPPQQQQQQQIPNQQQQIPQQQQQIPQQQQQIPQQQQQIPQQQQQQIQQQQQQIPLQQQQVPQQQQQPIPNQQQIPQQQQIPNQQQQQQIPNQQPQAPQQQQAPQQPQAAQQQPAH